MGLLRVTYAEYLCVEFTGKKSAVLLESQQPGVFPDVRVHLEVLRAPGAWGTLSSAHHQPVLIGLSLLLAARLPLDCK